MFKHFFLPLILVIFNFIRQVYSDDPLYKIKDFRSNPMGIAQREDLFRVELGISEGSRVLSYVDFNSDK
jgi:hypothetical protein